MKASRPAPDDAITTAIAGCATVDDLMALVPEIKQTPDPSVYHAPFQKRQQKWHERRRHPHREPGRAVINDPASSIKRLNVEAAKARQAYKVAHASALLRGEGANGGAEGCRHSRDGVAAAGCGDRRGRVRQLSRRVAGHGPGSDSGRTIASTIRSDQLASGAGV